MTIREIIEKSIFVIRLKKWYSIIGYDRQENIKEFMI